MDTETKGKKKKRLTTDTKVALDLSAISLPGESPVARLGFLLGLQYHAEY
jgi:hypothetical protein